MRTIVHLSDLHFGRLDSRVVAPLVSAIREIAPDLVAVSGDFTQRARAGQFAEARDFLQALPCPRLVVPGNHDVPLYDVARRFLRPLAGYRRFIAEDLEPVFVDAEIVALGLNSARSFTFGRGRLNAFQIRKATERLRAMPPNVIKIIVTHHPFDLPDDYDAKHLVGRAKMAMAELASVGADLFLSGHLHVSHIGRTAERYQIEGYSALVVQAGTMSTRQRGEANSFNVLRVNRPHITVERRTWDDVRQAFVEASLRRFRHSDRGWIEET
ncbi:MAG TPA: metallophosphoesterase family protein [Vicinamibacterales bacterium]